MLEANILTHIIAVTLGSGVTYTVIKIKNLIFNMNYINSRLDNLEENITTPEEMAKKLLSIKMPIKDLPPEVIEQFRQEAEKTGKTPPSYMG